MNMKAIDWLSWIVPQIIGIPLIIAGIAIIVKKELRYRHEIISGWVAVVHGIVLAAIGAWFSTYFGLAFTIFGWKDPFSWAFSAMNKYVSVDGFQTYFICGLLVVLFIPVKRIFSRKR